MSNLSNGSQSNIKKVLRTALVGIKPADQVMLKGYLRVLLRLEADLEWVSANHEQVDLFMISEEFHDAPSVQKLLSNVPDKPVLYVKRTDEGEGSISGDIIVLPLKRVTELSDWLERHVAILSKGDVEKVIPSAREEVAAQSNTSMNQPAAATNSNLTTGLTEVKNTPVNAHKVADTDNVTSHLEGDDNNDSNKPSQTTHKGKVAADYESIIALIKQLQQKSVGLFELIVKSEVVAIVEPSTGRLWQTQHTAAPVLSLDWQLKAFAGQRPEVENSQDLNQWLWNRAWTHANEIIPLVSGSQKYHLRYWIKPRKSDDRRELLRIMTALETAPRTISELAQIAEVSVISAKKAVVGLLLSGNLSQESYQNLTTNVTNATNENMGSGTKDGAMVSQNSVSQSSATEDIEISFDDEANPPVPEIKLSPLETVLARRESGEAIAPTSSHYDSDATNTASQPASDAAIQATESIKNEAKKEKRGFLSKLRSKLGL